MAELNVHTIDVADYQPRNLGPIIQAYQVKHVIVHLYLPGEGQGPQYSKDQINSARDHGATAGGYVFPYRPTDDVERYISNTLDLCASVNLVLPCAWVDCEPSSYGPGPDESWMDRWFGRCDDVQMPSGFYGNQDWFHTHPSWSKYGVAGRPLWLANWDHIADVTQGFVPHGWTKLAGKQWEVAHGPLGEIDRDVFREEYTVPVTAPVPAPGHTDAEIIEGLRIALDDVAWERLGRNIEAARTTADIAQQVADAAQANLMELTATRTEARRIRTQFLGQP